MIEDKYSADVYANSSCRYTKKRQKTALANEKRPYAEKLFDNQ